MDKLTKVVGRIALWLIVCIVVVLAALTLTPRKFRIRAEAFTLMRNDFLLVIALLDGENPLLPPGTPDSPIVIRGGSLDVFSNRATARWTNPNKKAGYFYQAALGTVPSSLYFDGVSSASYPIGPGANNVDPQQIVVPAANNWLITLNMRSGGGPAYICTQLGADQKSCNRSPSGALTTTYVYFEAGHSDIVGINDFDRLDIHGKPVGARIHYTIPYCALSDGSKGSDYDSGCDKLSTVTVDVGDGSKATPLTCIDGACDIKINVPPPPT